jgi:threonine synthase
VLALDAKFDDCQALVKQAFSDHDLDHLCLSSANSINISRLIPQIVYHFYAFSRLTTEDHSENVASSVPSGNFGDMMGGILAMKMGLPVKKFIIATNENDEFPNYLSTGRYEKVEPSRNCISSAMNVGHPSNLARLVTIYGGMMDEKGTIHRAADMELMRKEIHAVSISDEQTRDTIRKTYGDYQVILEPHGAVSWSGMIDYLRMNPLENRKEQLFISLETAHPAKFPAEIQQLLGLDPPLPKSLLGLDDKQEFITKLPAEYDDFKKYLLRSF